MKHFKVFLKKTAYVALITSFFCCGEAKQGFKISEKPSLLWEISGNNLTQPSYLYGTIHFFDSAVFRIPEEIFEAINLCDNFALEVDFDNINQAEVQKRTFITYADSTLDKILEPEVYAELKKIPFIKMMGETADKMKPILLGQFVLIENPLMMQSVDLVLNKYAKQQNKYISGIETIEEQLDAMDKISLAEQAKSIEEMWAYCKENNLGFREAGKKMFEKLMEAYKTQNFNLANELEKEFNMTSSSPTFDSAMLTVRNINMADRISDFISENKTLFVAVGMAHIMDFGNAKGVVPLLKEKGYTLRPILIDLNKR